MISMIQPLHVGNALRLFLQPPADAVRWKVLRKGSGAFTGHDDPSAIVAYEGEDHIFVDTSFLQNEVMAFYCPFYTSDGVSWVAGSVVSGTPNAVYQDLSTDALSLVRERLEAGLLEEVKRGNFATELGYIQVYTAPPSLEQNIRLPLVTVHLEHEAPAERGIGEMINADEFNSLGWDWHEAEGWIANVQIAIIGWALNSDERIDLRKAIRRIILANLPVFSANGMEQVSLSQQDIDAINGEYTAQLYQVMSTFTCIAPVRVGGDVDAVRDVTVSAQGATNG